MGILIIYLVWNICLNRQDLKIIWEGHKMAPTHCEMKHRVIFWPLHYLGENSGHTGPKANRRLSGRSSEHSAVLGKFYKSYRLFIILIHEQTCWFTVCANGLQTSQTKIPGKIWHVSTEFTRSAWTWAGKPRIRLEISERPRTGG